MEKRKKDCDRVRGEERRGKKNVVTTVILGWAAFEEEVFGQRYGRKKNV